MDSVRRSCEIFSLKKISKRRHCVVTPSKLIRLELRLRSVIFLSSRPVTCVPTQSFRGVLVDIRRR